jgi:hypothetical protein
MRKKDTALRCHTLRKEWVILVSYPLTKYVDISWWTKLTILKAERVAATMRR